MNNTSECPNNTANIVVQNGGDWTNVHSHFIPERAIYHTMLIWFVLGIPGSILSLIIWTRKRMRHSSSIYLSALAITDLAFLLLAIVFYLHQAWNVHALDFPIWCELFPTAFIWAQYSCPILTLAFTVERYISVCHPFQHERYCTVSRAMKVTISILCGCLGIALFQVAVHKYNFEEELCDSRAWIYSPEGTRIHNMWSWLTELSIFAAVPISILIFNVKVIAEMQKIKKRDQASGAGCINSKSTTITLLCVSFCLILGTVPAAIAFVLSKYITEGDLCLSLEEVRHDAKWNTYLRFIFVKTIVFNLCSCHFAMNFYIYIITGKAFRKEFMRLVRKCVHRLSHCCSPKDDRRGDRRCYSAIMSSKRSGKEHNGIDSTFV